MRNNKAKTSTKKTASSEPPQKSAPSQKTKKQNKKDKKAQLETRQKVAVPTPDASQRPLPGPFIRSLSKANNSDATPFVKTPTISLERPPLPQKVFNQVDSQRTFAEILGSKNGKTGLKQNGAGTQQQKTSTTALQKAVKLNAPPTLPISRPEAPPAPLKNVATASTGLRMYSHVVNGGKETNVQDAEGWIMVGRKR
ncbi:hypothetical protein BC829DRAFT_397183 [Chytridium lagenaria]|nr:hypothetical protein BC829DRAFT_397183 [Chytridium lagenaria]